MRKVISVERGEWMEKEKEKKSNIFKRLHASKKKQVLFCVVSMLVIILGYIYMNKKLDMIFEVKRDDFSWVYQIDRIQENSKNIEFYGWAFELKQDSRENAFDVILYDTANNKGHYLQMNYVERQDVNEYFMCQYDYSKSGFIGIISKDNIDIENGIYEILIRPEGKKKAYSTGIYYAEHNITFVHPKEFVELETKGTDLEEVIANGILRVYRPDVGMYVYQYLGDLYWITEQTYNFMDGDTIVQFQMDTTQIDRLSKTQLENGWHWSNLSFHFSDNELHALDLGKYRVTKCALPTKYSISRIWTGNFVDGWIWKQYFRPWYEFK